MMKKAFFGGIFLAAAFGLPALAQECRSNFQVHGLTYTTSEFVPNVTPEKALPRLAENLRADGYLYVNINQSAKSISAVQDGAGSGRPQSMRVTTRRQGQGTRISLAFTIQPGQIAPIEPLINSFCDHIHAAR